MGRWPVCGVEMCRVGAIASWEIWPAFIALTYWCWPYMDVPGVGQ